MTKYCNNNMNVLLIAGNHSSQLKTLLVALSNNKFDCLSCWCKNSKISYLPHEKRFQRTKNPTHRRHSISWCVWIVAPIPNKSTTQISHVTCQLSPANSPTIHRRLVHQDRTQYSQLIFFLLFHLPKKSRLWMTLNLSTCAERRTNPNKSKKNLRKKNTK